MSESSTSEQPNIQRFLPAIIIGAVIALIVLAWMKLHRGAIRQRESTTMPRPIPIPEAQPITPQLDSVFRDTFLILRSVISRRTQIADSLRIRLALALSAFGVAAVFAGWHPVLDDVTKVRGDYFLVIAGAILLFMALALIASRVGIRPRQMTFSVPIFSGGTLWFFLLPAVVLMTVMLYWLRPELAIRGFPYSLSIAVNGFTDSDFRWFRVTGIALMVIGLLPNLLRFIKRPQQNLISRIPFYLPTMIGAILLVMQAFWRNAYPDVPLLAVQHTPPANDQQLILMFSVMSPNRRVMAGLSPRMDARSGADRRRICAANLQNRKSVPGDD